MVIGGYGIGSDAYRDVEVINLADDGQTCLKPKDAVSIYGMAGMYFDGHPFLCGGYRWSESKQCHTYNKEVV